MLMNRHWFWIPIMVLKNQPLYFQAKADSQHSLSLPLGSKVTLCIPQAHVWLFPMDYELFKGKDSSHISSTQQSWSSMKRSICMCRMNQSLALPRCLAGKFTHKQVGHRKNLHMRHLSSLRPIFSCFVHSCTLEQCWAHIVTKKILNE